MSDEHTDESLDDYHRGSSEDRDFASYRRLILHELRRQNKDIGSLDNRVRKHEGRVTILEVKAAMYGSLGGSIGGAIVAIIVSLLIAAMRGS